MVDRFRLAYAEKCIYNMHKYIKGENIMKSKLLVTLLIVTLVMAGFAGCGTSSNNVQESTETVTEASAITPEATAESMATPELTEAPHEHAYTETITTEATCEADGEATYTCECGDSYTELIIATGHAFETYTSNNDATYTADGTETAECSNCDVTDTRTAEGSMLTYTYTDMDATMYAQQTVNVRSMPNTDGEKLGSLSTNDEVKVTGQCVETSWYRIEYSGDAAYVSNSYLGNDKVVVQTETTKSSSEFPYELYTIYDNGTFYYHYTLESDGIYPKPQYWYDAADATGAMNITRFPDYNTFVSTIKSLGYYEWNDSGYTLNGEKVMMEIRWKW